MTPTEKKAREIYESFVNVECLQDFDGMDYELAKQCALICVGNEYISLREQLLNLRSCKVIENGKTCLVRLKQLIDEEQEVKNHIEKL